MGDRIRVPAFGEHRHRHNTADVGPELAGLPHRVHHLPQEICITELGVCTTSSLALNDLAAELFNLRTSHLSEVGIEGFTALQLLAVDQQGARAWNGIAIVVVVPEQGTEALAVLLISSFIFDLIAAHIVVDELGCRSVVADDDEARRHSKSCFLPLLKSLLIMPIQCLDRCLQLRG